MTEYGGQPDHPLYEPIRTMQRELRPLREIGDALNISHEYARRIGGPPPMPRRRPRLSDAATIEYMSLPSGHRPALRSLARRLGLGSPGLLLDALASGDLALTWRGQVPPEAYTQSASGDRSGRYRAEPWVWDRLEERSVHLGLRITGPKRRRARRVALLLDALITGAATVAWRPGCGPETMGDEA